MTTQSYFDVICQGAIFAAIQVWHNDDTGVVEYCPGAWEWEQVSGVLGPTVPAMFAEAIGPTCCVMWGGRQLHIRANHEAVLRAWVEYKLRFGGQYIRLNAS